MAIAAVGEAVRVVAAGMVAALLPAPENVEFARRHWVDPGPYSFALGLIELILGSLAFLFGGIAYIESTAGDQAMHLMRNWFPGLNTSHIMSLGLLNWLAWLINPLSWVCVVVALTGAARCAAFVAAQQPVGEPVVLAGLRLYQLLERRWHRLARESDLGPRRPDRILRHEKGAVTIFSARDRPEWTKTITLQIGGRFFRLVDSKTKREGDHHSVAYTFRPLRENEIIRGLLQYRPPETPSA